MRKTMKSIEILTNKKYSEVIKSEIANNQKVYNLIKMILNTDEDFDVNKLRISFVTVNKYTLCCVIENIGVFYITLLENHINEKLNLLDIGKYLELVLLIKIDDRNIDNTKNIKNFKYIKYYNAVTRLLEIVEKIESVLDISQNAYLILLIFIAVGDKDIGTKYSTKIVNEANLISDENFLNKLDDYNKLDDHLVAYNDAIKYIRNRFEAEISGYERLYEEKLEEKIIII